MLSIVIPTLNEKDNIHTLIKQIDKVLKSAADYEVIFVDDSTDDTPLLLERLSQTNPQVRYLHRDVNKGLASAVVCGFDLAKGDVVAVMDADLQHPPELLSAMFASIEDGADIVLPSRYIGEGESKGLSPIRTLFSKSANMVGRIFLKSMKNVSDPMSGFFMFRHSVIDGVDLRPIGWKILIEILALGNYDRVVEIPYTFEKRNAGQSKLNAGVMLQYLLHIISLAMRGEGMRSFATFSLVGFSGVIVDMLCYSAISTLWNVPLNLAVTLSACVAMITNYILNRNITWKRKKSQQVLSEFLKYILVCCAGIGIKNVVVFLIAGTGMAGLWCNLCGILAASVANYIINDRWVFRSRRMTDVYSVPDQTEKSDS